MNIHLEKSYRLKRMFFKQIILIFNFCLLSISAHSIAFVEPKISPFANSLINQLCQNYVSEIHKTFDDIVELCEDIPVLGKGCVRVSFVLNRVECQSKVIDVTVRVKLNLGSISLKINHNQKVNLEIENVFDSKECSDLIGNKVCMFINLSGNNGNLKTCARLEITPLGNLGKRESKRFLGSIFKPIGQAINNHIIKPIENNVIKPIEDGFNNNIIKPIEDNVIQPIVDAFSTHKINLGCKDVDLSKLIQQIIG